VNSTIRDRMEIYDEGCNKTVFYFESVEITFYTVYKKGYRDRSLRCFAFGFSKKKRFTAHDNDQLRGIILKFLLYVWLFWTKK